MPPRPALPADDLYARLEIGVDASPEVIELAWRSLLRLHHPDVAGPGGLERSKRINVAHDWLSDPDLRATIRPRARAANLRPRHRRPRSTAEVPRDAASRPASTGRSGRDARSLPRPGRDPRARRDRPARLRGAGTDRLRGDDRPVPAAGTGGRTRGDGDGGRGAARPGRGGSPRRARRRRELRDRGRPGPLPRRIAQRAVPRADGRAPDAGLGCGRRPAALWPERGLGPGPDRAAGRPGCGRASRRSRGPPDAPGVDEERVDDPWPPGFSPDDDEALRVSSILAARDAAAAIPRDLTDAATATRAGRSAARLAHLLVLRHAFAPSTFASLTRPWRPRFLPDDRPAARVHRPGRN